MTFPGYAVGMVFELLHLAAAIAAPEMNAIAPSRVIDTVIAVRDVSLSEEPIGGDRELTARLLIAWSWHESRWNAAAINAAGDCGPMGTNRFSLQDGVTCAAIAKDARLGFRAGLAIMRREIARCGSVRGGLGAYATTGKCGGAPQLVASRCRVAGC